MKLRCSIALGLIALALTISVTGCRGPRSRDAQPDEDGPSRAVQVGGHVQIRATD